ncbi:MAG TPA: GNAT family N-acetyltransferase [Syntrophaceticus sp.]|nr:GNAT family N-acetyltransferase [Syntrophaceticus sp.]
MNKEFQELWKIYQYSFPASERRDLQHQKQILDNPLYHIMPLYAEQKLNGFLAFWNLKSFIFIEHLAIKKELRGKGYGSKAIERLISKYPKIVLEVEKPDTCNARRRISFYERLGFILNLYPYLQPPYNPRMHPVPLFLMSFPHKLNKGEFRQTKDILYKRVYHQTHPLDAQGETGCSKDSDSQFTIPHSSS